MIILNKKNIGRYVKDNLADKLDFFKEYKIENVASVGGGLVSSVYKVTVNGINIYFKQAIPGHLDKLKKVLKNVPDDVFILFNDDRQLAEVKALQIFEKAIPENFVPHVYYHDVENKIIVLSQVCDDNSELLADVMNEKINVKNAEILGRNIALLSNGTYNKIKSLRNKDLEEKIRNVKYKYEIGKVWGKIKDNNQRKKVEERANEFIKNSLKINKVLVHGDYQERNIVICGNKCATFDLEEGHLGDPVEDIGKIVASYLLRIIYFEKVRKEAFESSLKLLNSFFLNLKIPEDSKLLEERLKVMIGGCMLLRVDGISSKWLSWIHDENKKEISRKLSTDLLLSERKITADIIEDFYHKQFSSPAR